MPGFPRVLHSCGLRLTGPQIHGLRIHESRIHESRIHAAAVAARGWRSFLCRRPGVTAADPGRRRVRRCDRLAACRRWWDAARRRRQPRMGGPARSERDPRHDRNYDHPWTRHGRNHRGHGPVRPGGHGAGGAADRRPPPTRSRPQGGRHLPQPRRRRRRPAAPRHDHAPRHRTHRQRRGHAHARHGRGDRRRRT